MLVYRSPSGIQTVFYHCLGLRRGEALGGFTGSIRIRIDSFAKDILDILRTDVCL